MDIHSDARLTLSDAERQLAGIVVGVNGAMPVRLGEVADIVRAPEPPIGAALYDGRPTVYVQISKLPWADTLTVTRHVEQALQELAHQLPRGARVEPPVSRQASFVETSVRSVMRAMAIGSPVSMQSARPAGWRYRCVCDEDRRAARLEFDIAIPHLLV